MVAELSSSSSQINPKEVPQQVETEPVNSTGLENTPKIVSESECTMKAIVKPPPPKKKWTKDPKSKEGNDCHICGMKNSSEGKLIRHFKSDHKGSLPIQFKCDQCDHIGYSRAGVRLHIQRRHGCPEDFEKYRRFGCTLCDKKYLDRQALDYHFKTHTGESDFPCDQCEKTFRHQGNLKGHIRRVHQGIRSFECTMCPKKFKTKNCLEYHLGAHEGVKKFLCHICGTRRGSQKNLDVHFNQHKNKWKDWVEPESKQKESKIRRWRIKGRSPGISSPEARSVTSQSQSN